MARAKIKVFFETVENGIYKNGYIEISKKQFNKLAKQEQRTLKSNSKHNFSKLGEKLKGENYDKEKN